ncbi:hypothetical protein [Glycomyces sp. NPDC021274]|uniref:hypothetical protein n=1 Tax=Glycomyces sp. NPDC021274 TaxID=3155120 RepID=UPI003405D33E
MDSSGGLITISDAAGYLGLPRSTVASWADTRPRRGWINAQGEPERLTLIDHGGPHKTPRYEWAQIRRAEFETRHNRKRSHRKDPKWANWRLPEATTA